MSISAQERFDNIYISSREIVERLEVSRPTISQARKRGLLPDPVVINDTLIYLWERSSVEPYLVSWEMMLRVRRGQEKT